MKRPIHFPTVRHPVRGAVRGCSIGRFPLGGANTGRAGVSALGLRLESRQKTRFVRSRYPQGVSRKLEENGSNCRPRAGRDPPGSATLCADPVRA